MISVDQYVEYDKKLRAFVREFTTALGFSGYLPLGEVKIVTDTVTIYVTKQAGEFEYTLAYSLPKDTLFDLPAALRSYKRLF